MAKREYPDSPQIAVGAIVIKDNKVLLVRRSQPPDEGLWAIPGGRVELGETLQDAVEREIMEETGLIIRARNPIYVFDVINRDAEGNIRFHYVIVDLSADYVSGKPNAGDDVNEARWVSSQELDELPLNRTTLECLKKTIQFGSKPS